jgi:hypothetical protein
LKRKEKEIRKKKSASPHRPPSSTCAEAQLTPHRPISASYRPIPAFHRPISVSHRPIPASHRPPVRLHRPARAAPLPLSLSLAFGPTCQLPIFPLLSFSPDAHRPPRSPASYSPGPARQCDPAALQKRPFITPCPNPSPATPRRPQRSRPFPSPRCILGLAVVEPLHCAPDHHDPRKRLALTPGSFSSPALEP